MNPLRWLGVGRDRERDPDDMHDAKRQALHDQQVEHDATMARVRGLLSPENRRIVEAVQATADGLRRRAPR